MNVEMPASHNIAFALSNVLVFFSSALLYIIHNCYACMYAYMYEVFFGLPLSLVCLSFEMNVLLQQLYKNMFIKVVQTILQPIS